MLGMLWHSKKDHSQDTGLTKRAMGEFKMYLK